MTERAGAQSQGGVFIRFCLSPWWFLATYLVFCPAPLAMANAEFLTPLDYGGVGDGITDDSNALQQTVSQGRICQLASHVYRITRRILLPADSGLIGPGEIRVDFDSSTPDFQNVALLIQGDGVQIRSLLVNKVFLDGSYGIGIASEGRRDIALEGLEIRGYSARYGIHLIGCEMFMIRHCQIHDFLMNTTADMIADSPAGTRLTDCRYGIVTGNLVASNKEVRDVENPPTPTPTPTLVMTSTPSMTPTQTRTLTPVESPTPTGIPSQVEGWEDYTENTDRSRSGG